MTGARKPLADRLCRWTFAAFVALLLLMGGALVFAGRWLAMEADAPIAGDVAVVLAGSYDRTLHAVDLYRQGLVRRVVISRPVAEPVHLRLARRGISIASEEDTQRQILTRLGVPASVTDVLPGSSRNTRDESVALARYLGDRPLKVIVVTSPLSARRVAMILGRHVTRGQLVQVVATPYEEFEWRWWRDPASARVVLLELAKVVYFLLQRDDAR